MKICFIKKGDDKYGSNRIYINNIIYWIKRYHKNYKVFENYSKQSDIYIFSKYVKSRDILEIKNSNPNSKFGIIHPSDLKSDDLKKIQLSDFLIVGSLEEKDYYSKFEKKIIRFPQIEIVNYKPKKHIKKKKYQIGYHGNLEHLEEMDSSVKNALEKISREFNIKLIAVYDKSLGVWKRGRPNVNIQDIQWKYDVMLKKMSEVDIGIVPCTNNFFLDNYYKNLNFFYKLIKNFSGRPNNRSNDYIVRFKATSNAGRCFVFHQLGIPVVADFWPSNFEIIAHPKYGRVAHTTDGWYHSLKELLISQTLRQEISNNSYKEFSKRYNPKDWIKEFLNELKC